MEVIMECCVESRGGGDCAWATKGGGTDGGGEVMLRVNINAALQSSSSLGNTFLRRKLSRQALRQRAPDTKTFP